MINAGGIIFVDYCRRGMTDPETIRNVVGRIEERLSLLFRQAAAMQVTPETAAVRFVNERIKAEAAAE